MQDFKHFVVLIIALLFVICCGHEGFLQEMAKHYIQGMILYNHMIIQWEFMTNKDSFTFLKPVELIVSPQMMILCVTYSAELESLMLVYWYCFK